MQCNCAMGLIPEINRAWLVIDSNIYVWNYENGRDLAYFDGLNEVILSAGLVLPKSGVFQDHIQFLLCLTTAVEIVILGVSFTGKKYAKFYTGKYYYGIIQLHKLILLLKCIFSQSLCSAFQLTTLVCWTFRAPRMVEFSSAVKMAASMKLSTRQRTGGSVANARKLITLSRCSPS